MSPGVRSARPVIDIGDRPSPAGPAGRAGLSGVPEWPVQRRASDLARGCAALVVLAAAGVAAHLARPTVVETNLFRLINQLPTPAGAPLLGLMQLGALGAVPVMALIAVVAGRQRLAAVLAAAGVAAWGASKLVQYLVDEEPARFRVPNALLHGTVSGAPGLAFPASHVAVATAITVAVGPYIGRPARRACWLVTSLVAIARIYVGLHLPVDVLGGLALGALVGAAVDLAFGVPARGPAPAQLTGLFSSLGADLTDVEAIGVTDHLRCRTKDGRTYLVKTLDWDRPDQGWLSRLWRLAAYRERYTPLAPASPAHRAEHEAHVCLVAERAGLRTPPLAGTKDLGRQRSLVVREWVDAIPLAELTASRMTDLALADAFAQVAALHRAGIAHRRLSPGHVLVDASGQTWIVGLGGAAIGAERSDQQADVAELLVILAGRVGATRAIAAGESVVGTDALLGLLVDLQPLALGPAARSVVAGCPEVLATLRGGIAALDGRPPPQPTSPARVAFVNLVPVVGVAAAVYVLLPRLAQSSTTFSTLTRAKWPWLVAVAGGACLTYLLAAVALMAAAGRPLSLVRTCGVQLAAACTNRVVPAGLGAAATNVRYLELAGLDRPSATTAVVTTSLSGLAVHTVGTATAVALLQGKVVALHVPDLDHTWPELAGLAGVCAVLGWILWARRVDHAVRRWVRAGTRNLGAILASPPRVALLLGCSAGISAGYILALAAALEAFGVHLGLGSVAGVYLTSSAVAAAAPTPGGVGPFEAAAVAGLGALGVHAGPAVASVITYRLITYWLPVAPGGVALHTLRRRGLL